MAIAGTIDEIVPPQLSRKHVISDPPYNDNFQSSDETPAKPPGGPAGSSAGDSALLLVESLIHHLVGQAILTVREATEIVDVAADVESELALAAIKIPAGEAAVPRAATTLAAISDSLRHDLKD